MCAISSLASLTLTLLLSLFYVFVTLFVHLIDALYTLSRSLSVSNIPCSAVAARALAATMATNTTLTVLSCVVDFKDLFL